MNCDCQLGRFDCEKRVRCFLGGYGALDELVKQVTPLIAVIVNRKLRSTSWREDREDVIQEVVAVLCKPPKLQTWLDKQDQGRGAPFCHWVAVVAANCTDEWIRKQKLTSSLPPGFDPDGKPDPGTGLNKEDEEQAKGLRETIRATVADCPRDWQLVFYMRWSYVEPTTADIQRAAGLSERAVFWRLREMYERINLNYGQPVSKELGKVVLVGILHPAGNYDYLAKSDQIKLNESINRLLATRPQEQQLAFYARYSPLALEAEAIGRVIDKDPAIVHDWIERLESEVSHLAHAT
jgi:DNA-directed RNA polymerase specialized sigma24 family protein